MTARKTGTASRTRTLKPWHSGFIASKLEWWKTPTWSTRRVAAVTATGVMFASNPVTIMAAVSWVERTATDWHAAAVATGLL